MVADVTALSQNITVINLHKSKTPAPGAIRFRVCRPTALGNPFKIPQDGTRAEVIEKYRRWLYAKIQAEDPAVLKALREIGEAASRGKVELGCYCVPLDCHCFPLIRAIEWLWRQAA